MDKKTIAIIVISAVAVLLLGAIIGYLVYMFVDNNNETVTNSNVNQNLNANLNLNNNLNANNNLNSNLNANLNSNANLNTNAPVDEEAFISDFKTMKDADLVDDDIYEGYIDSVQYYNAGIINEGKYIGDELIIMTMQPDGMYIYPWFFRFIKSANSYIFLSNHSDDLPLALDDSKFTVDETTQFDFLDYPETIIGENSRQVFKKEPYINALFSEVGLDKVFTHATYGDVYTTIDDEAAKGIFAKYGFYIKSPDNTAIVYTIDLDFVDETNVPDISYTSGEKNYTGYTFGEVGGCGLTTFITVINDGSVAMTELEKTGVSSRGDKIYEFKNTNNQFLKDFYDNEYWVIEGEKLAYGEFIEGHPFIFFIDQFDRLVRAQSNTFIPPVECGKPVIYLYPEETTNVSVQVEPAGGMAVSEPAYNSGWEVVAYPTGEIFDMGSKEFWPYLFWEGRSESLYEQPDRGWVVTQAEVEGLLDEKLAAFGFIGQEIADFKEFWLPRMQDAPYYFVTFVGTQGMDVLAPLTVDPQPDNILRVLMDFSPLDEYQEAQGFEIPEFDRSGFVVTEWGGVIR